MKTYRTLMAGVTAALIATAAHAQTATPAEPAPQAPAATPAPPAPAQTPLKGRLAKLDANKDGVISADEFKAGNDVQATDADNDGALTADEVAAMIEKRRAERLAQRMMRRLDIDGDGKVTVAEIQDRQAKRFALLDRNNDGQLDATELAKRGGDRQGRRADRGDDRDGRDGWRHGGRDGKRFDHDGRGHHGRRFMPDNTSLEL